MRLRTTLFGLLVIVAVVLSGTVYAGFSLHKSDLVQSERTGLNATVDSLAENLHTRIEEKRTLVRLAAGNPHVVPGDPDAHPDRVVERFVHRTAFDGASVIDGDGTMRAIHARNLSSTRERELLGGNFSHRTYVQRALAGATYVGEPVEADSGNHVVTISAPIEREGRVVGVFTGTLHLERTSVFAELPTTLEPGQGVTLRNDGRVIYRSGDRPASAITASARTGEIDWQVTVHQDRDHLESALLAATLTQFGAVGVALLSIAALGLWISRTTLGNIRSLIAGLTQLEDGNYGRTLALGPTDEWARISSQFNSLADTLDQRDSQLRVLNRVLRHNLRNDMSVIIAHTETLLEDGSSDEDAKLEKIRQTAYNLLQTSGHARAIYEDLLSEGAVDRHPVDLVEVVESDLEPLREDFPESRIETHLPESAWVLDGDTIPIVVDELCRNALVHNDLPEPERELSIEVEPADDEDDVRLLVRDNGPGFPDLEAELLTGNREETAIQHGSGLGLWVVNWLVVRLGGDVSVRTASDRGSTVTVRLPVADGPNASS